MVETLTIEVGVWNVNILKMLSNELGANCSEHLFFKIPRPIT